MKRYLFLKIALGLAALGLLYFLLKNYAENYSYIVIFVLFLAAYSLCMGLSEYGTGKMTELAQFKIVKPSRVIIILLSILSPFYLFWILAALIPIKSYEVWFITGFPAFFLTMIPLASIIDFMKNTGLSKIVSPRLCYIINLVIYFVILFIVQFAVNSIIS